MGGPAQDFGGAAGIGIGGHDIAFAPGRKAPAQGHSGRPLKGLNDFKDGGAFARSKVKNFHGFDHGRTEHALQGYGVGSGEVDHMNVVADGRSIPRGVVVAVYLQGPAKACRTLGEEGH